MSELPALTVTALTNCSLQLLLPTTKARFVFLINLSTVLYTHTHTHRPSSAQKELLIYFQLRRKRKNTDFKPLNVAEIYLDAENLEVQDVLMNTML